jgi:hypothetical protein
MYIHSLLPTGSWLKLVPPKISECGANDYEDDPVGRKIEIRLAACTMFLHLYLSTALSGACDSSLTRFTA